jgi:cation transporter-like permease
MPWEETEASSISLHPLAGLVLSRFQMTVAGFLKYNQARSNVDPDSVIRNPGVCSGSLLSDLSA